MDTSLNSLVRDVLKSESEDSNGYTLVSPVAMDALRNYMERVPDEDGALNQQGVDSGNDYKLSSGKSCWIELEEAGYVVHIVNNMSNGTKIEVMDAFDTDCDALSLGCINIPRVYTKEKTCQAN